MHLGKISFCDKVAFNIKSDDCKERILSELKTLFNFNIIQKHYQKYIPESIQTLNDNPHLLCVRSNGNPYLMYLTKHNHVNQCIFVDKKIQHGYFFPRMILTKLWFNDDLFNNTLFDGEMVKNNKGEWVYLIHDIIGKNGQLLSNINLVRRLVIANEILKNDVFLDNTSVCSLQIKKFFTYDAIYDLINEYIPSLNYTCRGIYFKTLFLKFKDTLVNFDDTLIKKVQRTKYKTMSNFLTSEFTDKQNICKNINPVSESSNLHPTPFPSSTYIVEEQRAESISIDCSDQVISKLFYAKKTSQPDIYDLLDSDNVQASAQTACINSLKVSKMMHEAFAAKTLNEKIQIKCTFSRKFNKWVPAEILCTV